MMSADGKSQMPRNATPADHSVGRRIATLRKANGVTRIALCDAIGVSLQQLRRYEIGLNRVGAGRLREIARLLEVPVSTFFENGREGAHSQLDSMYGLLATSDARELLRLYASIQDDGLRARVVAMVRHASRLKVARFL